MDSRDPARTVARAVSGCAREPVAKRSGFGCSSGCWRAAVERSVLGLMSMATRRCRVGMLVGLTVACAPAQPQPSQPAPRPTVELAPPMAPSEHQPAPSPPPTTAPAPHDTVLFDYQQGGNAVGFVSPTTILFRRATHGPPPCRTQLRGGGNMWSGADVESAFRNSEVSFALEHTNKYQGEGAGAKLTAPGYPGSITWAPTCSACPAEPPGVKHFRRVMQTVVKNRSSVCP